MLRKSRCITCEICGVRASRIDNEKRKFMAKFPLDEARCRQWVKIVGKEDLIYVPIEKLNVLKYVCGDHFDNKAFNKKKNRLKKFAIPSKNLEAAPLSDEMLLEFPCHINSNIDATMEYVFHELCDNEASLSQVEAIAGPSDSETSTSGRLHLLDHDYCAKEEKVLRLHKRKPSPSSEPSTSGQPHLLDHDDCIKEKGHLAQI